MWILCLKYFADKVTMLKNETFNKLVIGKDNFIKYINNSYKMVLFYFLFFVLLNVVYIPISSLKHYI